MFTICFRHFLKHLNSRDTLMAILLLHDHFKLRVLTLVGSQQESDGLRLTAMFVLSV